MTFRLFFTFLVAATPSFAVANFTVTFEEKSLPGPGSFYNGNDGTDTPNSNGWTSSGVFFSNSYSDLMFPGDYWSGWSYSNVVNTTTAGFGNQYAAFPGGGSNGSGGVAAGGLYAMAYGDGAYFNLPAGMLLQSVDLANATYAAISMRDGDMFARKFGDLRPTDPGYSAPGYSAGNYPDHFGVILNGYDSFGGTGNFINSVTVDLADYRFPNNNDDYILDRWQNVSLSRIANARSVSLEFFSTDKSGIYINQPTYLALDNLTLTAVPEPSSILLVGLLASAVAIKRRRATFECCDLSQL